MTVKSAGYLTHMFTAIEGGCHWPQQLLQARAIYFLKDPAAGPLSILNYRILTICSHLYRKWACCRLHDITQWITSWADPCVFGGVPGKAAAEAAWWLGAQIEHTKACDTHLSAMSVDIYKCFDQLSRQCIFVVGARMGAP
eukprot:8287114-Alexandrium_andersonii.AAC.1